MKTITLSKEAVRTLTRMPRNTAALIRSKLDQYAADRASLGNNVKPLRGGGNQFRLRIGDWRVLFTEDGEVLAALKVAPRGAAYD